MNSNDPEQPVGKGQDHRAVMTRKTAAQLAAIDRAENVRTHIGQLSDLITVAWRERDDQALGYESWSDYCIAEFGKGETVPCSWATMTRRALTADRAGDRGNPRRQPAHRPPRPGVRRGGRAI
jgi:hypothetical protein